nr:MAG TPA: hypothetical protein [Caudoviricetes sp.]
MSILYFKRKISKMQDYSPSRIGITLVGSQPTDRRQKQL